MAGYPPCRVSLHQEVVGCPAAASLHHPLVQVGVCVCVCLEIILVSHILCDYMFPILMYRQQMAPQAVNCPRLDLGSLRARLRPVQPASEDGG